MDKRELFPVAHYLRAHEIQFGEVYRLNTARLPSLLGRVCVAGVDENPVRPGTETCPLSFGELVGVLVYLDKSLLNRILGARIDLDPGIVRALAKVRSVLDAG